MAADPSALASSRLVMGAAEIEQALEHMAQEIAEHHHRDLSRLALVGIRTRGVEVARRLQAHLQQLTGVPPAFGTLDISMHRDDLRRRVPSGSVQATELPLDLDDRAVLLADDVFFTGRTIRAALDALGAFGRPFGVQLAVLIDRGGRQLPIRPDYVGKEIVTAPRDRVRVRFEQIDGEPDGVWLVND